RLTRAARGGIPVHGRAALVFRRLASVPGYQDRADLSPGRLGRSRGCPRTDRGRQRADVCRDGRIVCCEQNGRKVSRMNRDGSRVETVAETWSGQRLNSPNDIVARSDGLLFFTDPPYGVEPAQRALHFQGLYALDLAGTGPAAVRLLADDLEKPNGLAFSPDERILYVCDTARYHVRAFEVEPSGSLRAGSSRV